MEQREPGAATGPRPPAPPVLTPSEVERLRRFKQRYWLEAQGFTPAEAARLQFFRWLREANRLR